MQPWYFNMRKKHMYVYNSFIRRNTSRRRVDPVLIGCRSPVEHGWLTGRPCLDHELLTEGRQGKSECSTRRKLILNTYFFFYLSEVFINKVHTKVLFRCSTWRNSVHAQSQYQYKLLVVERHSLTWTWLDRVWQSLNQGMEVIPIPILLIDFRLLPFWFQV